MKEQWRSMPPKKQWRRKEKLAVVKMTVVDCEELFRFATMLLITVSLDIEYMYIHAFVYYLNL